MRGMKCKKHPKYKAKLKPRVNCEACWYLWAAEHWFACIETAWALERVKGCLKS